RVREPPNDKPLLDKPLIEMRVCTYKTRLRGLRQRLPRRRAGNSPAVSVWRRLSSRTGVGRDLVSPAPLLQQRLWPEQPDLRRCQLDGERQAVEPPAERGDYLGVRRRQREAGGNGRGALNEELHAGTL